MKRFSIISLLVLMAIGWAGTNHLPNMKFKDLKNKKQSLSQYYSDGPILLNFWNLACEPCKKEMKELDKLNIRYRDQGFDYVSINIDSPRSMSKVKSYIKSEKTNAKLFPPLSPLTVTLDEALSLLAKRKKGSVELKTVGVHPETGEDLVLKDGRYGPYVTDGKVNASIPKESNPDTLSLEEATELINKRRAAPPKKRRRKKSK